MNWASVATSTNFHATGGRRRYNAHRQKLADKRRVLVALMLSPVLDAPSMASVARTLHVSRATICRDRDWLVRTHGATWWFGCNLGMGRIGRWIRSHGIALERQYHLTY